MTAGSVCFGWRFFTRSFLSDLKYYSVGMGCWFLKIVFTSLVAQLVKNPPAMWETWVQSPGWQDPLEKGKATHSSILAWRIPRTV